MNKQDNNIYLEPVGNHKTDPFAEQDATTTVGMNNNDDDFYRIVIPIEKPVRIMTRDELPEIEINGEIIEYEGLLDSDESLGNIPLGYRYLSELVSFDDVSLEQITNEKPLFYVNYYRWQENGRKYIFKGIFEKGCWTTDKNGDPMFNVSRMIESEIYS